MLQRFFVLWNILRVSFLLFATFTISFPILELLHFFYNRLRNILEDKKFIIHLIMIQAYIITTLLNYFTKEALTLQFMFIQPFVPGIKNMTFSSSIIFLIIELIYVVARDKTYTISTEHNMSHKQLHWNDLYMSGNTNYAFPLLEKNCSQYSNAETEFRRMANQNREKLFAGFVYFLHKITNDFIWLMQLSIIQYPAIIK